MSSDPLKDWTVQQWREMFGTTSSGSGKAGTTSDVPAGTGRYLPASPFVIAVTAAAFSVDRLPPSVTSNATAAQLTAEVYGVRWWLLIAAAAVVVLDVMRYRSHRWQQMLAEIVRQATGHTPVSVSVALSTSLQMLRKATVKLPRGTVIRPKGSEDLTRAVESAFPADAHWKIGVRHDARRDRLTFARVAVVPDTRSNRHRALQEAIDSGSILKDADVTVTDVEDGIECGYRIGFARSMNAASPGFQAKVAEALAGLGGTHESGRQWTTDWFPSEGHLIMRLVSPMPVRVDHPLELVDEDLRHLPYATGSAERTMYWDVSTSSNKPHCLIVGPTGGGKTSVIRTLLTEAARRGIPFLGVDPKMIELDGLEGYPGCGAIVYDPVRAAMLVRALHTEMMARNNYIHVKKIEGSQLPLMIAVLDEFFILSGKWQRLAKTGDDETKALLATLDPLGAWADLAVLARSAGIRLLLGVQRPDASLFGGASGNARDNFGTRISLGNLSQDGALMMWGDSTVGREVDTSVKGRGIALGNDGNPVDAQMWWTPNVDRHPNKWGQLSKNERDIIQGLEPIEPPMFTCYSTELADFIESERALAHRARARGTVAEPIVLSASSDHQDASSDKATVDLLSDAETRREEAHTAAPVAATAPEPELDDDPDDAIPASAVEPGQTVLVEGPDGHELVAVVVDEVDVERDPKTGSVLATHLTFATGRVRTSLSYPPTGVVFLPTADSGSP